MHVKICSPSRSTGRDSATAAASSAAANRVASAGRRGGARGGGPGGSCAPAARGRQAEADAVEPGGREQQDDRARVERRRAVEAASIRGQSRNKARVPRPAAARTIGRVLAQLVALRSSRPSARPAAPRSRPAAGCAARARPSCDGCRAAPGSPGHRWSSTGPPAPWSTRSSTASGRGRRGSWPRTSPPTPRRASSPTAFWCRPPAHPGRRRRRGFDHAAVLACRLAERTGLPACDLLRRPADSAQQVGQGRGARLAGSGDHRARAGRREGRARRRRLHDRERPWRRAPGRPWMRAPRARLRSPTRGSSANSR